MRIVLLYAVPLIVSVLAERERLQHAELAASYGTLQRHAATVEQLAVSRERNRLARELHDTLAHSLSAIAIQLEALRTLQAHNPQAAEQAVADLGGLARRGLADARHAIQELRSDPVQNMGLEGALREMLSALEARSGLEAQFTVSGQESDLTLEEAGALYRIAEEALLNVERHARAARVSLRWSRAAPGAPGGRRWPRLCAGGVGRSLRPHGDARTGGNHRRDAGGYQRARSRHNGALHTVEVKHGRSDPGAAGG